MSTSGTSVEADGFAAWQALLAGPELPELGRGPRAGVTPLATLETQCDAALKTSGWTGERVALARGAVLLWHDHHDASHRLAQDIPSREGCWLHGILHRREPDFSNAAYWFQRAGAHAAFAKLARRAAALVEEARDTELQRAWFRGDAWNAAGFIAACEQCTTRPANDPRRLLLEKIQAAEFEVFLAHLAGQSGGDARR